MLYTPSHLILSTVDTAVIPNSQTGKHTGGTWHKVPQAVKRTRSIDKEGHNTPDFILKGAKQAGNLVFSQALKCVCVWGGGNQSVPFSTPHGSYEM